MTSPGVRPFVAAFAAYLVVGAAPSWSAPARRSGVQATLDERDRQVLILTAGMDDTRFAATREAIDFWNETLTDLKLGLRLLEPKVVIGSPLTRAFENYTRQIWLLAGRPLPKVDGPQPPTPPELTALDGDIVVFLSKQQFFSFAWPFAERTRYFIGIQTDRVEPLTYPNVSRNVIAHELGHALGLRHNGNTRTLMCGPCEHLLYASDQRIFFPLTSVDRRRLLDLHQAPDLDQAPDLHQPFDLHRPFDAGQPPDLRQPPDPRQPPNR